MKVLVISILLLWFMVLKAHHLDRIVVDQNGDGDFRTVTEAINSLPMFNYERTTIFIKDGVYIEKIRIEQDYITLEGEDRYNAIIQYPQLRSDWEKDKDFIGPGVINIHADDIILENLTIENTQPKIGPHAFTIYGNGTRILIANCDVFSKGADTIALWDHKNGMYYLADCRIDGAVDFICPRGWCFMRDCQLYERKATAAIWHAGGYSRDQKFVIVNCDFDGVDGFKLGRHHYEAQFYLLNCRFSERMADEPIYRVTYPDNPEKNRPFNWEARYYFHNCHRDGGDFDWFTDNVNTAEGSPLPEELTAEWTFDHHWQPESVIGPRIIEYEINNNKLLLRFDEQITVSGTPQLASQSGRYFDYESGGGSNTICFHSKNSIRRRDLSGLTIANNGKLTGTIATVTDRSANLNMNLK